jgi:hypothetical protein
MKQVIREYGKGLPIFICILFSVGTQVLAQEYEKETYMPVVIKEDFQTTMARDKAEKDRFMKRQMDLLEERYDLSSRPADGLLM